MTTGRGTRCRFALDPVGVGVNAASAPMLSRIVGQTTLTTTLGRMRRDSHSGCPAAFWAGAAQHPQPRDDEDVEDVGGVAGRLGRWNSSRNVTIRSSKSSISPRSATSSLRVDCCSSVTGSGVLPTAGVFGARSAL